MSDAPSETIQPTSDSTPLIFISHSHKDEAKVHRIYDWLCRFGFRCWVSFVDLVENEQYRVISRKIEECDLFLLVWSQDSLESHEVATEITKAHKLRKKFVIYQLDFSIPDHNIDMFIAYKEFRVLPIGDDFERLELLIKQLLIESHTEKKTAQDRADHFVKGIKAKYTASLAAWQDHYWERRYDLQEGRARPLSRFDEASLSSLAEKNSLKEDDIIKIKEEYNRDLRKFSAFLRSFIGRAKRDKSINKIDLELLEAQRIKSCIPINEAKHRTIQLLSKTYTHEFVDLILGIASSLASASWLEQSFRDCQLLSESNSDTGKQPYNSRNKGNVLASPRNEIVYADKKAGDTDRVSSNRKKSASSKAILKQQILEKIDISLISQIVTTADSQTGLRISTNGYLLKSYSHGVLKNFMSVYDIKSEHQTLIFSGFRGNEKRVELISTPSCLIEQVRGHTHARFSSESVTITMVLPSDSPQTVELVDFLKKILNANFRTEVTIESNAKIIPDNSGLCNGPNVNTNEPIETSKSNPAYFYTGLSKRVEVKLHSGHSKTKYRRHSYSFTLAVFLCIVVFFTVALTLALWAESTIWSLLPSIYS